MAKKEVDAGDLSERAWRHIEEALNCGKMRLFNGREVELGPKELISMMEWLAKQRAKKPKVVAAAEDFNLAPTEE